MVAKILIKGFCFALLITMLIGSNTRIAMSDALELRPLPYLDDAVDLFKAGKTSEAEQLLMTLQFEHPDHPGINRLMAIHTYRQGHATDAITNLRAYLKKTPWDFFASEILLWLVLKNNDQAAYQQARSDFLANYAFYAPKQYYEGNYQFSRETFTIHDVADEFDASSLEIMAYEFYGKGIGDGEGLSFINYYWFNILHPVKGRLGYVMFRKNDATDRHMRSLGYPENPADDYFGRFYEISESGGRMSFTIGYVPGPDVPPYEAARQLVINHLKGVPLHTDMHQWLQ